MKAIHISIQIPSELQLHTVSAAVSAPQCQGQTRDATTFQLATVPHYRPSFFGAAEQNTAAGNGKHRQIPETFLFTGTTEGDPKGIG